MVDDVDHVGKSDSGYEGSEMNVLNYLGYIGLFCMPLLACGNNDERDIRALLTSTWNQPNAPLNVIVVVSENDVAIADWLQGQKGGRALLQKHQGAWHVVLCGGDGIKHSNVLIQAGISVEKSTVLLDRLSTAEATISTEWLEKLASFGPAVAMSNHHP